jgi:hypothetical protein
LHRSALADREFRNRLRFTRDAAEQRIFALLESGEPGAWARADRIASDWHAEIEDVLAGRSMPRLPRHWRRIARLDRIAAGGGAGDSAAGG